MRYRIVMNCAVVFFAGTLSCATTPQLEEHEHGDYGAKDEPMETTEHAGTEHQHGEVDFPVSCNEEAQDMIDEEPPGLISFTIRVPASVPSNLS